MVRQILVIISVVILAISVVVTPVRAYTIPPYENLVSDYAGVLSPKFEIELNTELQQMAEQDNGYEIAVVTVKSLNGESATQVAKQFYDEWKIGKSEIDNGVLLLVAINDHQVHLYTGEGAKQLITETEADTIIRNQIDPSFQQAAYEQGVRAAITEIRNQLTDEMFGNVQPINQDPGFLKQFVTTLSLNILIIAATIGLSYAAARYGHKRALWLGALLGAAMGTFFGGIAAGIFFGIIGLIFDRKFS